MTVRGWLAAIGVIAILLGYKRLLERRSFFLEKVHEHSVMKRIYGEDRGGFCPNDLWFDDDAVKQQDLNRRWTKMMDDSRDWEGVMERKYTYAASHPWLSVEPDTPRPDSSDYLRDE
jgi:hypothetical protein